MNGLALIILLASLLLALTTAYYFLQWKCPTRYEKITQILENIQAIIPEEETQNKTDDLDWELIQEATPEQIRVAKSGLNKMQRELKAGIIKVRQELKTKKSESEESEENEKSEDSSEKAKKEEELAKMQELVPQIEEMQAVVKEIKVKEDLIKKVYGASDYIYAGGIALVVLGIGWSVGNVLTKQVKGENG